MVCGIYTYCHIIGSHSSLSRFAVFSTWCECVIESIRAALHAFITSKIQKELFLENDPFVSRVIFVASAISVHLVLLLFSTIKFDILLFFIEIGFVCPEKKKEKFALSIAIQIKYQYKCFNGYLFIDFILSLALIHAQPLSNVCVFFLYFALQLLLGDSCSLLC